MHLKHHLTTADVLTPAIDSHGGLSCTWICRSSCAAP